MKRQLLSFTVAVSVLLTGCSLLPANWGKTVPATADAKAADAAPTQHTQSQRHSANSVIVEDQEGRVEVQKVEFRSGVSSATVERLATRYGCMARGGAGLLTEKGPLEVYRLQCEDGSTFTARCELRQCRRLH